MCLTLPARITLVGRDEAMAEVGGVSRRVLTAFTPEVAVGDWVIVSAGSVLRILDPEEAAAASAMLLAALGEDDRRPGA